MSKLHEILAVEGEAQGEFKKIIAETQTSFEKKANLYMGQDTTLSMFAEERKKEEEQGTQVVAITDTIPSKLAYTFGAVTRYLDVVLQKEEANQRACADLVVETENGDEITLATSLPATFLLGLESKLAALRPMLDAIPTLPPGGTWVLDDQAKLPGVYKKVQIDVKDRTEKTIRPVILAPATDKHPAQVQVLNVDAAIGVYRTQYRHGGLSPHDKSVLLGKFDRLLSAVKKARQRANCVEVKKLNIGQVLVDFLLK